MEHLESNESVDKSVARKSLYKSFSKSLANQSYSEITKSKAQWNDDLFMPGDESLYSGETSFSNYSGPDKVPDFIAVYLYLI